MPATIIQTLGDLIDNHHGVGAWCPGGHGFRPIDMDVLIARLGAATGATADGAGRYAALSAAR
jgi:hypothetical protein